MTPEAQRIEIAKARGWVFTPHPEGYVVFRDSKGQNMMRYYPAEKPEHIRRRLNLGGVPDYLNDLNEIFEAWVELVYGKEDLEDKYSLALGLVCGCEDPEDGGRPSFSHAEWAKLSNATAAQRAEALVRTLDL